MTGKDKKSDELGRSLSEIALIIERVFEKLDVNHDKVVSKVEIDRAVIDAHISEEDAIAVALLKAGFSEIVELHKEGWFARKKGITFADLLLYERILMMDEDGHTDSHHEQLITLSHLIVNQIIKVEKAQKYLYRDVNHPLLSIKPDAIRQGRVGDCFFLAALVSVVASNPQIIQRIIKNNDDGTYSVTFPGDRETAITVDGPTVVELVLYSQLTDYGLWPCVLEKAYGQYLLNYGIKKATIPTEATNIAQHTYEAFDLLTGQTGHWEYLPRASDEKVRWILTEAFRERRGVAAGSLAGKNEVTVDAGIPDAHAYSILGWDPNHDRIMLRNPWGARSGSEPLDGAGKALDGKLDGNFVMTLDRFRRNFSAIYYEDWTPDAAMDDGNWQLGDAVVERP